MSGQEDGLETPGRYMSLLVSIDDPIPTNTKTSPKNKAQVRARMARDKPQLPVRVVLRPRDAAIDRVHSRARERWKREPRIERSDNFARGHARDARLVERNRRPIHEHRIHDDAPVVRRDARQLRRARDGLEAVRVVRDDEDALGDVLELARAPELHVEVVRQAGVLREERGDGRPAELVRRRSAPGELEGVVYVRVVEGHAHDAVKVCQLDVRHLGCVDEGWA